MTLWLTDLASVPSRFAHVSPHKKIVSADQSTCSCCGAVWPEHAWVLAWAGTTRVLACSEEQSRQEAAR